MPLHSFLCGCMLGQKHGHALTTLTLWLALQILPDLTEERWLYNGTAALEAGRHKGRSAHTWVWKLRNKSDYGEYDNTYTFYIDEVSMPIAYQLGPGSETSVCCWAGWCCGRAYLCWMVSELCWLLM